MIHLAIKLRKRGYSINDISEKLGISKSTVSVWCSGIVLSSKQKLLLKKKQIKAGIKGRLKGSLANKIKKNKVIEDSIIYAKDRIQNLSINDLFIMGLGIYWSEGSKKDKKLSIVNSDPYLILLSQKWFKNCFGVTDREFMPRIFIKDNQMIHKDRILNFWSNLLNLPRSQFGNVTVLKTVTKRHYANENEYTGVLALRVSRGSRIRYKVLACIEEAKKQFVGVAQLVRAQHS